MLLMHRVALTLCSFSLLAAACVPAPSGKVGAGEGGGEADAGTKPEVVCKHVRDLAAKDSDDAAALDQVQRECVETMGKLKVQYQTFTTCVDLASDSAALRQCEAALGKPRALLAAASPTAKLEELCDHMLNLVQVELGEMVNNMAPEELQQLRQKCVTEAGAQIEVEGVDAFNLKADCILAAQTLQDIEACKL